MNGQARTHPPDGTLAAFVDGRIDADTRTVVLEHIETCSECMAAVLSANEQLTDGSRVAQTLLSVRRLAIAAAIVIAVIAAPLLLRRNDPIAKLVALAPHAARVVEPRLTGGFAWAEYAGAERATATNADPEQMKLAGAAGEMMERADRDRDADSQHAAGVAMVLVQRPAEGIARLESAAIQKNEAKSWSDLAAARYSAASQLGRASLYPGALAAADAALRIDPNMPEALFNRALIVERLGLADEARRAWQRYLEVDPSSPWAGEARTHLAELPKSTRSSQFEHDRPLLEHAAERGDTAALRGYVAAHPDRALAFAETEYLASWGEALQRNDEREAARWLTISRGIGEVLAGLSGESLLRDAVHAIDAAPPDARKTLAAAHILYRNARIAYSRGERDAAERDLLRAAAVFDARGDPMALMARYYAASAHLAGGDTSGARADLERARAAADAHPTYNNLRAHVRWELGRTFMLDDDWPHAVPVLTDGAAMFRRSGDRAREAFVDMMLAQSLTSLGREDDAWLARASAFAALSADGQPEMLATSVAGAMEAELRGGRRDTALALSAIELSVARVAMGAALAESDPRAAIAPLTQAIDFYAAHELPFALPEPLLLRSRCADRIGDPTAAIRDREQGMTIVERHPTGAGVLDADHSLYEDAIRAALDRGEPDAAFAFAERSRGATITVAELQRRLAGSSTDVLEIVALPEELITFAVSADDASVSRRARSSRTLAPLAGEILSESGTTAAAAMYDDLIRPADAMLARAREVVIVPDRRLENVPFAALYDSMQRHYLIERFAVSTASSAGSLSRETARAASPSVTTIALPSGTANSVALPEAEREVREIAGLYRHSHSVPAAGATLAALRSAGTGADVVHIAGHTERQPGGGEEALLFAGADGSVERVSWKSIAAEPAVHGEVIVLAACETLRPPASAATRTLSLGGAFSAAGAAEVVGTLAPIGDRDARLLFAALHRGLASGMRSAEALRTAQLEAIERDKTNGGRRAWRAVALLTRRISAPS